MDYLCIYAKPPLPGRTKQRLARAIGDEAAAALAAAMLADLCLTAVRWGGAVPLLWHPPEASPADYAGVVPEGFAFRAQQGADLGARMGHTFQTVLQSPSDRAILCGSDCVTFGGDLWDATLAALVHLPVVIQPAADGGYVMVAQSVLTPVMFERIDWGGSEVLAQTWERLQVAGIRHGELPGTWDVDEVADLARLATNTEGRRLPHTTAWLAAHGARFTGRREPRQHP